MTWRRVDLEVSVGDDAAPVTLDDQVERQVAALEKPLGFSSRSMATVDVHVRSGAAGTVEVWEPRPSTSLHPVRLGVIESPDADLFRPVLAEAERANQVVVCEAIRSAVPPPDGPLHLYVRLPEREDDGSTANQEAPPPTETRDHSEQGGEAGSTDGWQDKASGFVEKAGALVGGLALAAFLNAVEKRSEPSDEPQIISCDAEVLRLEALARDLAQQERSDDEAVQTLTRSAGRDRRNLSKAAARVRFGGHAKYNRNLDRANRLLLAAFHGAPVQPLSTETDEFFKRVDEISGIRVEEAWPKLVRLQPGLGDLEARFVPRQVSKAESGPLWDELIDAIKPLVGREPTATIPWCNRTRVGSGASLPRCSRASSKKWTAVNRRRVLAPNLRILGSSW